MSQPGACGIVRQQSFRHRWHSEGTAVVKACTQNVTPFVRPNGLRRLLSLQSRPLVSVRTILSQPQHVQPLRKNSRSWLSTTTEIMTTTSSEIVTLRQETREILQKPSPSLQSDERILACMKQWASFIVPGEAVGTTSHAAADQLQKLLDHWLASLSTRGKRPTTIEPFRMAMDAHRILGRGSEAIAVLDEWGTLLGGDLELAPSLHDYHAVLQAYTVQPSTTTTTTTTEPPDTTPNTPTDIPWLLLRFLEGVPYLFLYPLHVETYALIMNTIHHNLAMLEPQEQLQRQQYAFQKCQDLFQQLPNPQPRDIYYLIYANSYAPSLSFISQSMATLTSVDWQKLLSWWDTNDNDPVPVPRTEALSVESLLGNAYLNLMSDCMATTITNRLQKAQTIEQIIKTLEEDCPISNLPWPDHYQMAVHAWVQYCSTVDPHYYDSNRPDLHCQDLLERIEERYLHHSNKERNNALDETNTTSTIPLAFYERVLWVYHHCGFSVNDAERAEALLNRLLTMSFPSDPPLWTSIWNNVLKLHAHSGDPSQAMALWRRMQSLSSSSSSSMAPIPDASTYTAVLIALSRITHPNAAQEALDILNLMESHSTVSDDNQENQTATAVIRPSAMHYASVMTAWSQNGNTDAALQVEQLLHRLEAAYEQENRPKRLQATTKHYSTLMTAWSRSNHPDAVDKVIELWHRMVNGPIDIYPNVIALNTVLSVFARMKSRQGAEQAEALLDEVIQLPYVDKSATRVLRPSRVCYATVMSAWAWSGVPTGPERALTIFNRLLDAYRNSNRDETLRPDEATYRTVMNAWSTSGRDDAGDRAEEIIGIMEEQASMGGGPPPNTAVYSAAITAYGNSKRIDAGQKAEAILHRMLDAYSNKGNVNAKPNAISHSSAISAWWRSDSPDKVERAWNILQQMWTLNRQGNVDILPNAYTYAAMLKVCANTIKPESARSEAVRIAFAVMSEMKERDITPLSAAYVSMFYVVAKHFEMSERIKLAESVFQHCCKAGKVDSKVIEAFRMCVPPLYERLPKDVNNHLVMPNVWSRNVDKRRGR